METKKRIGYIDALRGFTMLLVVYTHIQYFGYGNFCFGRDLLCTQNAHNVLAVDFFLGGGNCLIYRDLITILFMPLFFFISGFVLYKPGEEWTAKSAVTFVAKKAKLLLIPTAVFIALYVFVYDRPLILLTKSARLGYWFTIALFEYNLLYALFRLICKAAKRNEGIDWLLLIGSALLYFLVSQSVLRRLHVSDTVSDFIGLDQLRFFCYFSIGILSKKHFSHLSQFMDNGKFVGACMVTFLGIFIYVHKEGFTFPNVMVFHLYNFLAGYLSVFIVFLFFYKYQTLFSDTGRFGKALQYVGRHTLAIYMLHYFFLPRNLQFMGEFFASHPNPTIELITTTIVAILVIGISLLANSIICTSLFLAHLLFGIRK